MGVDYSLGLLSLKFWMNRRRSLNFLIFSIDLWVFCVAIEFWVSFIEKLFGHWLRGPFDNTTIAHTLIKGGQVCNTSQKSSFYWASVFQKFLTNICVNAGHLTIEFLTSQIVLWDLLIFLSVVFNRCALFSSIQLLDDFRIESLSLNSILTVMNWIESYSIS